MATHGARPGHARLGACVEDIDCGVRLRTAYAARRECGPREGLRRRHGVPGGGRAEINSSGLDCCKHHGLPSPCTRTSREDSPGLIIKVQHSCAVWPAIVEYLSIMFFEFISTVRSARGAKPAGDSRRPAAPAPRGVTIGLHSSPAGRGLLSRRFADLAIHRPQIVPAGLPIGSQIGRRRSNSWLTMPRTGVHWHRNGNVRHRARGPWVRQPPASTGRAGRQARRMIYCHCTPESSVWPVPLTA